MKVGQKVVCVNDGGFSVGSRPLRKGCIYLISVIAPCDCGDMQVDVGINSDLPIECQKTKSRTGPGIWWFHASRFRPLEELSETTVEDILEPFTIKEGL